MDAFLASPIGILAITVAQTLALLVPEDGRASHAVAANEGQGVVENVEHSHERTSCSSDARVGSELE